MKYLKTFEGGNDPFAKKPKYNVGDYIIVTINDPSIQLTNQLVRIDDVASYLGETYWYKCTIPDENGNFENRPMVEISKLSQIKRKLTKKEVSLLLTTKRFDL